MAAGLRCICLSWNDMKWWEHVAELDLNEFEPRNASVHVSLPSQRPRQVRIKPITHQWSIPWSEGPAVWAARKGHENHESWAVVHCSVCRFFSFYMLLVLLLVAFHLVSSAWAAVNVAVPDSASAFWTYITIVTKALHNHYICLGCCARFCDCCTTFTLLSLLLGPGHLRAPSEDANSELLQTAMRVASSRVVLDVLGHFLVREAYTCPNACQDPRDT